MFGNKHADRYNMTPYFNTDRFCHLELSKLSNDSLLSAKVLDSLSVIENSFSKWPCSQIGLSFNGGKDSVVLLVLICHICEKINRQSSEFKGNFKSIFFQLPNEFPEIIQYVQDMAKLCKLNFIVYHGGFMEGLLELTCVSEKNPDPLLAIFMGTRRTDPGGQCLTVFTETDNGWPSLMRINPLLDWDYFDIWKFLKIFNIPVCHLYFEGYTSVGGTHNTRSNPCLWDISSFSYLEPWYLPRADNERLGRGICSSSLIYNALAVLLKNSDYLCAQSVTRLSETCKDYRNNLLPNYLTYIIFHPSCISTRYSKPFLFSNLTTSFNWLLSCHQLRHFHISSSFPPLFLSELFRLISKLASQLTSLRIDDSVEGLLDDTLIFPNLYNLRINRISPIKLFQMFPKLSNFETSDLLESFSQTLSTANSNKLISLKMESQVTTSINSKFWHSQVFNDLKNLIIPGLSFAINELPEFVHSLNSLLIVLPSSIQDPFFPSTLQSLELHIEDRHGQCSTLNFPLNLNQLTLKGSILNFDFISLSELKLLTTFTAIGDSISGNIQLPSNVSFVTLESKSTLTPPNEWPQRITKISCKSALVPHSILINSKFTVFNLPLLDTLSLPDFAINPTIVANLPVTLQTLTVLRILDGSVKSFPPNLTRLEILETGYTNMNLFSQLDHFESLPSSLLHLSLPVLILKGQFCAALPRTLRLLILPNEHYLTGNEFSLLPPCLTHLQMDSTTQVNFENLGCLPKRLRVLRLPRCRIKAEELSQFPNLKEVLFDDS